MKTYISIVSFFIFSIFSLTVSAAPITDIDKRSKHNAKSEIHTIEDFLNLTPRQYKKLTGKRLKFKDVIKLKIAQKVIKKSMKSNAANSSGIPQWLYIVLSLFGLSWIVMGIADDWSGTSWWVNLLLALLGIVIIAIVGLFCPLIWLLSWQVPSLIHALVIMKNYY